MIKKEDIAKWFDDKYPNLQLFVRLTVDDQIDIIHDCITELSQDKWVSVDTDTPKEAEAYFVTDGKYINIAQWNPDDECFYDEDLPEAFKEITHWRDFMELPNDNKITQPTEEDIMCCPQCGSGDVSYCSISVRPHCNECKYWGMVNFTGTKHDSIKRWNDEATRAGR